MIELIFEFVAGLLTDPLRRNKAIGYKSVFGIFLLLFLVFALIHDLVQSALTLSSFLFASFIGSIFAMFCTAAIFVSRKIKTRKEWQHGDS